MRKRATVYWRRAAAPAIVLALMAAVFAAGCAKSPDDAAIKSDVQSRFYADQGLKSTNLQVVVTKGQVMLTGEVSSVDLKARAVQLAGQTQGVQNVEDRITVAAPTAAATAPPSAPREAQPETATPKHATPAPRRTQPTRRAAAPPPEPARPEPPATAESAPPAQPPKPAPAQPAPAAPVVLTIPAGTHLSVRMIDSVDSSKDVAGKLFLASVDAPVMIDGEEALPAGADVTVRLAAAKSAGKMTGSSELELQLVKVVVNGHSYPLESNVYSAKGKSRGKDTATKVGAGAAIGAVIGAIAGGGKGAAIGAATGAGAGAAVQLATRGQQVKVPSETLLDFQLQTSVTVSRAQARQ